MNLKTGNISFIKMSISFIKKNQKREGGCSEPFNYRSRFSNLFYCPLLPQLFFSIKYKPSRLLRGNFCNRMYDLLAMKYENQNLSYPPFYIALLGNQFNSVLALLISTLCYKGLKIKLLCKNNSNFLSIRGSSIRPPCVR